MRRRMFSIDDGVIDHTERDGELQVMVSACAHASSTITAQQRRGMP